ncbi:MAG: Zn-ribbon containing protein [archaeon]
MPHQCVRCGKLYEDNSGLNFKVGCDCGGKLFFFVKKEHLEEIRKAQVRLSKGEKKQIEEDVYELLGIEQGKDMPVVLDFESIRVLKPGKYELDLVNIFKDNPLVYKLDEGKYMIDLPESFRKITTKKGK